MDVGRQSICDWRQSDATEGPRGAQAVDAAEHALAAQRASRGNFGEHALIVVAQPTASPWFLDFAGATGLTRYDGGRDSQSLRGPSPSLGAAFFRYAKYQTGNPLAWLQCSWISHNTKPGASR